MRLDFFGKRKAFSPSLTKGNPAIAHARRAVVNGALRRAESEFHNLTPLTI